MQYTKLKGSDIEISKLCVGDPLNWTLDPHESEEIVKTALSLGINFFATNREAVGAALRRNVARDKVVLAAVLTGEDPHEVDDLLKRLGTDYIDLLLLSHPVENLPSVVKAGKVRALGELSRPPRATTPRGDMKTVEHVQSLAQKHGASMTQIALARQFAKGVTAAIVGTTKKERLVEASASFFVDLSPAEAFLEEPYFPPDIVGVIA